MSGSMAVSMFESGWIKLFKPPCLFLGLVFALTVVVVCSVTDGVNRFVCNEVRSLSSYRPDVAT